MTKAVVENVDPGPALIRARHCVDNASGLKGVRQARAMAHSISIGFDHPRGFDDLEVGVAHRESGARQEMVVVGMIDTGEDRFVPRSLRNGAVAADLELVEAL